MKIDNVELTYSRQIAIAASCWLLSDEDADRCNIVLQTYLYFPNVNPEQLLRAADIKFLPTSDCLDRARFAELNFPSNAISGIKNPRQPIEESATLVKLRKHISGKWVALALPVWHFDPQVSKILLDIPELREYNKRLAESFSRREVI